MTDYSSDPWGLALIRRDVRFALSIVDECRCVGELANVMQSCLMGVATTNELHEKLVAFGSGIAILTGAPIPLGVSFQWGTA